MLTSPGASASAASMWFSLPPPPGLDVPVKRDKFLVHADDSLRSVCPHSMCRYERLERPNVELRRDFATLSEMREPQFVVPSFVPQGLPCVQSLPYMPQLLCNGLRDDDDRSTCADSSDASDGDEVAEDGVSRKAEEDVNALIIRNVPKSFTTQDVLAVVHAEGFKSDLTFCYAPVILHAGTGAGYAFACFISREAAVRFTEHFTGFDEWGDGSLAVEATPCQPCGVEVAMGLKSGNGGNKLQDYIAVYRNSPIMHESVPDSFKPVVLENGVIVPFPAPTKSVKKPPRRRC